MYKKESEMHTLSPENGMPFGISYPPGRSSEKNRTDHWRDSTPFDPREHPSGAPAPSLPPSHQSESVYGREEKIPRAPPQGIRRTADADGGGRRSPENRWNPARRLCEAAMNQYSALKGLLEEFEEHKSQIYQKLLEFQRIPAENYFYELTFCLMTPQSSALHALQVQLKLEKGNFREIGFDPEFLLREKEHYIRFHRVKAIYLLELRRKAGLIEKMLHDEPDPFKAREWLVQNISGVGYKEATHFLRNIGRNNDLAILDRHIARNLQRYAVVKDWPTSLSRKRYIAMEEKFQHFANTLGISVNELDLLFWSRETGVLLK
jgi:N-glycosylase/DNA lyase